MDKKNLDITRLLGRLTRLSQEENPKSDDIEQAIGDLEMVIQRSRALGRTYSQAFANHLIAKHSPPGVGMGMYDTLPPFSEYELLHFIDLGRVPTTIREVRGRVKTPESLEEKWRKYRTTSRGFLDLLGLLGIVAHSGSPKNFFSLLRSYNFDGQITAEKLWRLQNEFQQFLRPNFRNLYPGAYEKYSKEDVRSIRDLYDRSIGVLTRRMRNVDSTYFTNDDVTLLRDLYRKTYEVLDYMEAKRLTTSLAKTLHKVPLGQSGQTEATIIPIFPPRYGFSLERSDQLEVMVQEYYHEPLDLTVHGIFFADTQRREIQRTVRSMLQQPGIERIEPGRFHDAMMGWEGKLAAFTVGHRNVLALYIADRPYEGFQEAATALANESLFCQRIEPEGVEKVRHQSRSEVISRLPDLLNCELTTMDLPLPYEIRFYPILDLKNPLLYDITLATGMRPDFHHQRVWKVYHEFEGTRKRDTRYEAFHGLVDINGINFEVIIRTPYGQDFQTNEKIAEHAAYKAAVSHHAGSTTEAFKPDFASRLQRGTVRKFEERINQLGAELQGQHNIDDLEATINTILAGVKTNVKDKNIQERLIASILGMAAKRYISFLEGEVNAFESSVTDNPEHARRVLDLAKSMGQLLQRHATAQCAKTYAGSFYEAARAVPKRFVHAQGLNLEGRVKEAESIAHDLQSEERSLYTRLGIHYTPQQIILPRVKVKNGEFYWRGLAAIFRELTADHPKGNVNMLMFHGFAKTLEGQATPTIKRDKAYQDFLEARETIYVRSASGDLYPKGPPIRPDGQKLRQIHRDLPHHWEEMKRQLALRGVREKDLESIYSHVENYLTGLIR